MRSDRPSRTAAWVAACRGLGALLPHDARLCDDPYGARFGGPLPALGRRTPRLSSPLLPLFGPLFRGVLYMQVRTRVLDDALLSFVAAGGRQVLLLGAGFDCRAARFRAVLDDATFFEVDHPATQAKKRDALDGVESARVVYLPWDFERRAMDELPGALAALGHDPNRPTLTIWEGVTMYLTEPAIDATVTAVRRLSAPESRLAFTYFDRAMLTRPNVRMRLAGRAVARLGEPFRFGWDPGGLESWLAERELSLVEDRTVDAYARALLPARWARRVSDRGRHIAIARPR